MLYPGDVSDLFLQSIFKLNDEKIKLNKLDLEFLLRCRDSNIIPNFFEFSR